MENTRETHLSRAMGSAHSTPDAELLSHLRRAMETRNPLERSDTEQPGGSANAQRKMAEENKRACLFAHQTKSTRAYASSTAEVTEWSKL